MGAPISVSTIKSQQDGRKDKERIFKSKELPSEFIVGFCQEDKKTQHAESNELYV
jgi:hypothetical protein